MKICGIICEYNPFHNGHKYQIDKIKELTGCDFTICAMSGNFTQRAEPALLDKYTRATSVDGCDLIVGIPTAYSVNNAEVFAMAGIKVLIGLNVDAVCFGAEESNIELLKEIAKKTSVETNEFKKTLKEFLSLGISFNAARLETIKKCFKNGNKYVEVLSKPNNILAVEYLKALILTKSKIEPYIITRIDNYNSKETTGHLSSGTSIRELLKRNEPIDEFVPNNSKNVILKSFDPETENKFNDFVKYNLPLFDKQKLEKTFLVTEGIENRILSAIPTYTNYNEFVKACSTKKFNEAKMRRIILNYLLGIDKDIVDLMSKNKFLPYIKAIGFKPEVLGYLKNRTPLILRKNDIDNLRLSDFSLKLQEIENRANLIYNLLNENSHLIPNDIYTLPEKI